MNDEHPNRDAIDGFRALAAWLEQHPQPFLCPQTIHILPPTKKSFAEAVRGVGGVQKKVGDTWYYCAKRFGTIEVCWALQREHICERVVIGTQTVPAEPEKVLPAMPERVVEIVEWKCPESIFA